MARIDARSLNRDVQQHNRQMAVELFHEGHNHITSDNPQQLHLDFALCTAKSIRALIHQLWRIDMPLRTIRTYVRRWEFTPQKPLTKAYEQRPKKVQQWLDRDYPII